MNASTTLPEALLFPAEPKPLTPVRLRLPRTWPGYVLSGISLVFGVLSLADQKPLGEDTRLLFMASDAAVMVYWYFSVYRLQKILRIASHKRFRLSPGWAVIRFLVPLYGMIWSYQWPRRIARFLQAERSDLKISFRWPGVLVLLAMLLGALGLRGFLLFPVIGYLNRRVAQVVELEAPAPFLTRAQLDLATSAGLGAGFGLVLCQAIQDFFNKDASEMFREVGVVALVSVGVVKFIEPLGEWVRHAFLPEQHHAEPVARSWVFKAAVLMAIAFTGFSHEMIDEQIKGNPTAALRLLSAMLLVSGGITYAWVCGARCQPARAGRRGLISGAFIALVLLIALWTDPAKASHNLADTPEAAEQVGKVAGAVSASLFIGAEVRSVPGLAVPLGLWALFGLIGGLAIDRKWRKGSVSGVVLSVLITALVVIVALRLTGFVGSAEIALGASAVIGWCLALLLFPTSGRMLCPHAHST